MSKVGRNDPCPCGSGKKYKKCCLQKDEEATRQRPAATALPGLVRPPTGQDRPAPALIPATMETVLTRAEQDAMKRWERFEAAGWDERAALFEDTLTAGLIDSDEAFEMLNELYGAIATLAQQQDFLVLLGRLRSIDPDLYQEDFGYYNVWRAEILMTWRQYSSISELLEPFAQNPERFPGEFAELMRLLMYHGQIEALLDAMQQAWPKVEQSHQIMDWAIEEFSSILSALTIFAYLDLDASPTADASMLIEAVGRIGERDREHDRRNVLSMLGDESVLPAVSDVADGIALEQLYGNVAEFSLGWLGELRRGSDVPWSKGELARMQLVGYLFERAETGKRGVHLLIPEARSLDMYLRTQLSAQPYGVYEVGSLLELLPYYVDYLIQRGVLDPADAQTVLHELRGVQGRLVREMTRLGLAPEIIRTVRRAWLDTAIRPDGVIRHDAAGLGDLLGELIEIGQYLDQDLMERIKARGQEAIEPLIEIATDMDLHQSDQESPRVWAPIHAIQLLGQLEAAEAVEPLLPYFDWDDDWLAMVLPEAFALIGEPALGPMRALLSDRTREDLIRGRAAEALGRMGQDHPDLRDQVVEALVEQLDQSDRHNDEEAVVNGFIISELVDLKAREAVPAIRRAFIDDRVDTMIIDPPFVEEELGLLQGTVDVG